jgi:hypothetical protein
MLILIINNHEIKMTKKTRKSNRSVKTDQTDFFTKNSVLLELQKLAHEKKMTLQEYSNYLRSTKSVDNNIIMGRSYFDVYHSIE